MKRRLISAGLLAACAIAASATPAFGDEIGTVSGQVTPAAPCIQVTPPQLDFGTLGFSPSAASPEGGSRGVSITNCGPGSQNVLAHGTYASSTQGTSWYLEPSPTDLCATTNRFGLKIDTGTRIVELSITGALGGGAPIEPVAAGQTAAWNALLVMPCGGSSGAGEIMTFSYVFTAVLG